MNVLDFKTVEELIFVFLNSEEINHDASIAAYEQLREKYGKSAVDLMLDEAITSLSLGPVARSRIEILKGLPE